MKNLIRLKDYRIDEVKEIYEIADKISQGKYAGCWDDSRELHI